MKRIDATVTWFDDEEVAESPGGKDVPVRLGYGDDCLFVDGLADDRYLCVPLVAVGQAIAQGARDN